MAAPLSTPPASPQTSKDVQIAPPFVGFNLKDVPPTQAIYLQLNDSIFLNLLTNVVGATVRINYRYLTPQGDIKEGEFDSPPFTASFTTSFQLGECWLLSLGARSTTFVAAGQWTFLHISIARFPLISATSPMHAIIWQGYLPVNMSNGWPGTPAKEITDGPGTIRAIVGTVPGAGADINEVVPGNRRWNLLGLSAQLTTDAVVANRQVSAILTDTFGNIFFEGPAYFSQTATQVKRYSFMNALQGTPSLNNFWPIAAPIPIPLKNGYSIKTSTANIDAGDQWTAPTYLVQEWGSWDS